MQSAECVRFATPVALTGGSGSVTDLESREGLVRLTDAPFRATYMPATKMRNEIHKAERNEELTVLITAARRWQEALPSGAPD